MQILQLTVLILFFTLPTAAQAATCGNGGWCPSTDRGSAGSSLLGGSK